MRVQQTCLAGVDPGRVAGRRTPTPTPQELAPGAGGSCCRRRCLTVCARPASCIQRRAAAGARLRVAREEGAHIVRVVPPQRRQPRQVVSVPRSQAPRSGAGLARLGSTTAAKRDGIYTGARVCTLQINTAQSRRLQAAAQQHRLRAPWRDRSRPCQRSVRTCQVNPIGFQHHHGVFKAPGAPVQEVVVAHFVGGAVVVRRGLVVQARRRLGHQARHHQLVQVPQAPAPARRPLAPASPRLAGRARGRPDGERASLLSPAGSAHRPHHHATCLEMISCRQSGKASTPSAAAQKHSASRQPCAGCLERQPRAASPPHHAAQARGGARQALKEAGRPGTMPKSAGRSGRLNRQSGSRMRMNSSTGRVSFIHCITVQGLL